MGRDQTTITERETAIVCCSLLQSHIDDERNQPPACKTKARKKSGKKHTNVYYRYMRVCVHACTCIRRRPFNHRHSIYFLYPCMHFAVSVVHDSASSASDADCSLPPPLSYLFLPFPSVLLLFPFGLCVSVSAPPRWEFDRGAVRRGMERQAGSRAAHSGRAEQTLRVHFDSLQRVDR